MRANFRAYSGWILMLALAVLIGGFSYWLYQVQQANRNRSYSGAKFIQAQEWSCPSGCHEQP